MNDNKGNQGRVPKRYRVIRKGQKENDAWAGVSAGVAKQPTAPAKFLEAYLGHVGQNGLDLEDPDSLFSFAAVSGHLISPNELAVLKPHEIKGGIEHEVYQVPNPDGGESIIKVTRRPSGRLGGHRFGLNADAVAYFDRLRKMGEIAPGLNPEVLGITPKGTWPSLVTRFNYIAGEHPTPEELNAYLTQKLGFRDEGLNWYEHPGTSLRLGDAHTSNFIKTDDGRMIPIDVLVEGDI